MSKRKRSQEILRKLSKKELVQSFFEITSGEDGTEKPVAHVTLAELPEEYFLDIVRQHNAKLDFILSRAPEGLSDIIQELRKLKISTFAEFQNLLDDPAQRKKISPHLRKSDFTCYRSWVLRKPPIIDTFAETFLQVDHAVYVPEKHRKRHVFCVGKSGSGKTETLKLLALSSKMRSGETEITTGYPLVNRDCSFVLIDPHGDFALEMAKQKMYYGDAWHVTDGEPDLIYIDPFLASSKRKPGTPPKFPTINPFDVWEKGYTDYEIEKISQQLTRVFQTLVTSGDNKLTTNMETLLIPCITVLLKRPKSTLFDLLRFLRREGNQDLVNLGKKSGNPGHRFFFAHSFLEKRFDPTKGALSTKVQSLLNNQAFAHFLAGERSTIDLESALNGGKSIIVNCSSGKTGPQVMKAIGSFIVGMVLAIAFNRAEQQNAPRTPIWLTIDEMQNFVSDEIKTILAEARKYALHLVLACQVVGQDMSPQLSKVVMGNTSVKLVGNAGADTQNAMSKEMNLHLEEFADLEIGEFVLKYGAAPAMKIKMNSEYVGKRSIMSPEQWKELKAIMIDLYYAHQPIASAPKHPGTERTIAENLETAQLVEDIGAGEPLFDDDQQDESETRKPRYGTGSPFADVDLDV